MDGNDKGATTGSTRQRLDAFLAATRARAEQGIAEARRRTEAMRRPNAGPAPVESETQELRTVDGPGASSTLVQRLRVIWEDPARRQWILLGAIGVILLIPIILFAPALVRQGAEVTDQAVVTPAPVVPPEAQPAEPAQPAESAPAAEPAPPAEASALRRMLFTALPLLLGLFWLLSAWLVDAEARRAFVIQEPWGERRTVAYSALAVGCVFPLILAGLIFTAWGFVTFVLDVARTQSPIAGIQAGAVILMIGAGFLLLRGAIVRWLETRRGSP
jgi:hypothetical protein